MRSATSKIYHLRIWCRKPLHIFTFVDFWSLPPLLQSIFFAYLITRWFYIFCNTFTQQWTQSLSLSLSGLLCRHRKSLLMVTFLKQHRAVNNNEVVIKILPDFASRSCSYTNHFKWPNYTSYCCKSMDYSSVPLLKIKWQRHKCLNEASWITGQLRIAYFTADMRTSGSDENMSTSIICSDNIQYTLTINMYTYLCQSHNKLIE